MHEGYRVLQVSQVSRVTRYSPVGFLKLSHVFGALAQNLQISFQQGETGIFGPRGEAGAAGVKVRF